MILNFPSSYLRNVFRRGVLKFTTTLAIGDVCISKNTTIHSIDLLSRHFELIPLDQSKVSEGDMLYLDVTNELKQKHLAVTSDDVRGGKCESGLLLLYLRPGESISAEFKVVSGTGDDHAKFSLVEGMEFREDNRLKIETPTGFPPEKMAIEAVDGLKTYLDHLIPSDVSADRMSFEPGGLAPPMDRGIGEALVRVMNSVEGDPVVTHTFYYNSPVFTLHRIHKKTNLKSALTCAKKRLRQDLEDLVSTI